MFSIYLITNRLNGKKYVGLSKQPKVRLRQHRLASYVKTAPDYGTKFKRAIREHGIDAFEMTILEEGLSPEEVHAREIHYIKLHDSFNNGYNSTMGGDGTLGAPKSDETREKIRRAHIGKPKLANRVPRTEEVKEKIRQGHIGKTRSEATRKAISDGKLGKSLSDEHRESIGAGNRGKVRSAESRERYRAAQLGKPKPAELVAKMRATMLQKYADGWTGSNAKTYIVTKVETGEEFEVNSLSTWWRTNIGTTESHAYKVVRCSLEYKGYRVRKK